MSMIDFFIDGVRVDLQNGFPFFGRLRQCQVDRLGNFRENKIKRHEEDEREKTVAQRIATTLRFRCWFIIRIWLWIIKNCGRCQNMFSRRGSWCLSALYCTHTINTRKPYRERNADQIRTLFAVRATPLQQKKAACKVLWTLFRFLCYILDDGPTSIDFSRSLSLSPFFVLRWFRW